jgi:hypothetical protein
MIRIPEWRVESPIGELGRGDVHNMDLGTIALSAGNTELRAVPHGLLVTSITMPLRGNSTSPTIQRSQEI